MFPREQNNGQIPFPPPSIDVVSTTAGNVLTVSAQATYDFSRALLVGAAQGAGSAIVGMVDTFLHPIDNMLYPISSFLYDATLISAGHVGRVPTHFK